MMKTKLAKEPAHMASNSTNLFQTAKSLPKGVWAVSISMMLIAISTTMVFSISPFFITQVLGLSFVSLGIMEGISEGLSYFSKLASGFAGDFFKRKKPPLMIGVALATISKPLFILASQRSSSVFLMVLWQPQGMPIAQKKSPPLNGDLLWA